MSKRLCKDCKEDISNLQPQCIRCKNCQELFCKRKKETFLFAKKERLENNIPIGTTDFSSHRKKNFKKEAAAVRKELRGLGLLKKVRKDKKYRNPDDNEEEENEEYNTEEENEEYNTEEEKAREDGKDEDYADQDDW